MSNFAINNDFTAEDEFLFASCGTDNGNQLMTVSRFKNILHMMHDDAFAARAYIRMIEWLYYFARTLNRYKSSIEVMLLN